MVRRHARFEAPGRPARPGGLGGIDRLLRISRQEGFGALELLVVPCARLVGPPSPGEGHKSSVLREAHHALVEQLDEPLEARLYGVRGTPYYPPPALREVYHLPALVDVLGHGNRAVGEPRHPLVRDDRYQYRLVCAELLCDSHPELVRLVGAHEPRQALAAAHDP